MTSRARREAYDIGRWARPPEPHRKNARRWRYFLDTLDLRIALLRRDEAIDSTIAPWRTFDVPLPSRAPSASRPVRLRLTPMPTAQRDPRGRFLAGRRAS